MKAEKHTARDIPYDDIRLGDSFSFTERVDDDKMRAFAILTGDHSPLHTDEIYARKSELGGRVAHGMLLGSFFSTLVGMFCPGRRALYLSQDIRFRKPLKPGTRVFVSGTVTHKSDATHIIELKTSVRDKKNVVYIDGIARVKVRDE